MAKIEKSELTGEMIAAAMQCKTADELIALAKAGGYLSPQADESRHDTEHVTRGSLHR